MGIFLKDIELTEKFDIFKELNINIFNIIEIIGIHYTFKHRWLQMDSKNAKIISFAIG